MNRLNNAAGCRADFRAADHWGAPSSGSSRSSPGWGSEAVIAATRAGLASRSAAPRLVALLWLAKLALAVPSRCRAGSRCARGSACCRRPTACATGCASASWRIWPSCGRVCCNLALSALGLAALGLLAGVAATGGTLQVLCDREPGPLAERFGQGAFRLFGPFLRAGCSRRRSPSSFSGSSPGRSWRSLAGRRVGVAAGPPRQRPRRRGVRVPRRCCSCSSRSTRRGSWSCATTRAASSRRSSRGVRPVLRHPLQWRRDVGGEPAAGRGALPSTRSCAGAFPPRAARDGGRPAAGIRSHAVLLPHGAPRQRDGARRPPPAAHVGAAAAARRASGSAARRGLGRRGPGAGRRAWARRHAGAGAARGRAGRRARARRRRRAGIASDENRPR